jgi:hypothetical protein
VGRVAWPRGPSRVNRYDPHKGVYSVGPALVMARHRIDGERALTMLNVRKVVDVAEAVVESHLLLPPPVSQTTDGDTQGLSAERLRFLGELAKPAALEPLRRAASGRDERTRRVNLGLTLDANLLENRHQVLAEAAYDCGRPSTASCATSDSTVARSQRSNARK